MVTLTLPRLVGSRASAEALTAQLPPDLRGQTVALQCRDLVSASPSFADQLVAGLLVVRHADRLRVIGAGAEFAGYVLDAASAHGVAQQVDLAAAGTLTG